MLKRVGMAAALIAAAAVGWAASVIPSRAADSSVPILLYHRFDASRAGSSMTVTTPVFEQQLNWLADHGYKVARLGEVVDALRSGGRIDPRTVVITVDDSWRSQYTEMFPIILRHGVPVTLFVVAHVVSMESAELTWGEIDEMTKSGLVDVQSHTSTHPNFNYARASKRPADFAAFVVNELQGSKATLETRFKRPVPYLAWPYGVFNPDLERAAVAAGYSAAFIVGGRRAGAGDDRFAVPRIGVSDADRGARFARLLLLGGGAPVAAAAPPAACAAHGAAPASP
ncbi:MAG: polysaccharide deacetylase family protein [Roseiarcus sp.]|jgi:peptidoglycan/xylan/chitin deacetylase (PgdA/CDA1 family)